MSIKLKVAYKAPRNVKNTYVLNIALKNTFTDEPGYARLFGNEAQIIEAIEILKRLPSNSSYYYTIKEFEAFSKRLGWPKDSRNILYTLRSCSVYYYGILGARYQVTINGYTRMGFD